MKKRLRKKLKKGEFQELGFSIKIVIDAKLGDEIIDKVIDNFISEAIEANDLIFGGGGDHIYEGFCCKVKGTAAKEDLTNVANWINEQAEVVEYEIGALVDAWHPETKLYQHIFIAALDTLENDDIGKDMRNIRKKIIHIPND